jgi:5-methylcytosine-specific restriction enzyme subunit McrC
LLEGEDGRRLTVDAKYKLYDEDRLSTADIYQSFFYAYAYHQAGSRTPAALLLYPANPLHGRPLYLHVKGQNQAIQARLYALAVSIPQAIAEMNAGVIGPAGRAVQEVIGQLVGDDELTTLRHSLSPVAVAASS